MPRLVLEGDRHKYTLASMCVCVFLMCRFYIFVQTYNNWDHKTVSVPAILSTTSMLRLWQQQQMHAVATCMASSA